MVDDVRLWSEELARDPSSLVFLPLAETLRRRGQLDPAHEVAVRAIARHPRDPQARDLLARILVDRGDLQAAFDAWAVTLHLEPGHVGAIKGMAFISFQQGMLEESERLLLQAQERGGDATISAAIATVRGNATPRVSGSSFQSFVSDIALAVGSHLSELEEQAAAGESPSRGGRAPRNFFMDHEKVVWHWPDVGARITEDVR